MPLHIAHTHSTLAPLPTALAHQPSSPRLPTTYASAVVIAAAKESVHNRSTTSPVRAHASATNMPAEVRMTNAETTRRVEVQRHGRPSRSPGAGIGSRISTFVPSPRADVSSIVPPWASTICRDRYRPSPVPGTEP